MGKLSDFKKEDLKKEQTYVSEQDFQNKYNQYSQMNNDQLNNELLKEVSRQKQEGTFDYSKLESMVEGLKGALPEENYNKIKRILEGLNDN